MIAAILNSVMLDSDPAILDSDTLLPSLRFTQKYSHSTLTLTQTISIWLKLIHSHLTWRWHPSWIWPSCIQPSWIWPSWILPSWIWPSRIQPSQFFLSNSLTLAKIGAFHLHKITSLILSDSTWWWQLSWILPSSWIHTLPSWIQTPCYLLPDLLKNTLTPLNLMMAAILNSAIILNSHIAILDSDTLLSSLRFTQKYSHSTLTLNQTNSIWLKLIHSHLTWRWHPSWILQSWIQPSWIQPS